jgi:phosphoribosylformimino-5-aminoimidazole carboxamide ribotide isomerase
MIVPSIDVMGGRTVQLVGGKELALDAGDPLPIAERLSLAGEIAVVDLDAALGQGDNRELLETLCARFACRVGGGIRDRARAERWLDAGARKIVLGTAAEVELLRALPRERVIAALDAVHGEVVVDGWRTRTGRSVVERMRELRDWVGGFLVTFVEREGRMGGIDLDEVDKLRAAAGDRTLTVAGGVATTDDIRELDRRGVDAQVGMALYTGKLDLGDAIAAPLSTDRPDGLFATVIVDVHERALGLAWSSRESLREAVASQRGVYCSRRRGVWTKGSSSGATQRLMRVELDCDRDALRFVVEQNAPGFCHRSTMSCWGELGGLPAIVERVRGRTTDAPVGSYTRRLLDDPDLLAAKLCEEAGELAAAVSADEVAWEAADVLYFAFVAMARAGVPLAAVERELERRARMTTRRAGEKS